VRYAAAGISAALTAGALGYTVFNDVRKLLHH
jgi:hypothetical protein